MPPKIRWGVLGAAKIALTKVIPAMQQCARAEIVAIASRDGEVAEKAAAELGISKAYAGYDALIADKDIEAIYNPLPNHLHIPWSVKAAEAGKHVLCEKPIALNASETLTLIEARNRAAVKIGEAFMVRTHPLWLRARELVGNGAIGDLLSITSNFGYFNDNPRNIRNIQELGGGALMDIGCYPVTMFRFLFGREPSRVVAIIDRDPRTRIDRLTSALLDFAPGQGTLTCGTQLVPSQSMQIFGTKGRIEIPVPYNLPPDVPTRILVDDGSALAGRNARIEEFPVCDQYTVQGDLFSQAIQENTEVPVPLEDALANMSAIDALFRSAETGLWEPL